MTNKKKQNGQLRRLRIRSIRRNPPDFKKLASALIELAQAKAEADAEAQHTRREAARRRRGQARETEPPHGDVA
jgi:hypothetical protein